MEPTVNAPLQPTLSTILFVLALNVEMELSTLVSTVMTETQLMEMDVLQLVTFNQVLSVEMPHNHA